MSDAPVTALGGAAFSGLIEITESGPQGMISLRGDLADAAVQNAATETAALDMPDMRGASSVGEAAILWMSPDELMVLCPYAHVATALSQMNTTLKGTHALAADVSDARAVFHLKGQAIREVLAKITPADMRASALPVGELRRTRLAQVAAAFWLESETEARLICFRSVAGYVFELLCVAADQKARVGHF